MTDRPPFDFHGTLANSGPLSRDQAMAALDHAAELMADSQFLEAARLYQRIIGFDDRGVTAAALLGFGQAMHRLDEEDQAIGAWQEVVGLPVTPATYPAWRELAGARVRKGDLSGAAKAYEQADRLAPAQDKAEIASRLGWLSKELGDPKAAGRYFSRARGGSAIAMTIAIIAVTTVISLIADIGGSDGNKVLEALLLDKIAVAHGEAYRLFTVALVHAPLNINPLHLPLNMYAIWLFGPWVERMYGKVRLLAFYVIFVLGASLFSFGMADPTSNPYAVGASGGVFGIFGLLLASLFIHRPVIGAAGRGFLANLAGLIVINLIIGATNAGVDNLAHVGGLLTGLWIGLVMLPTGVPTVRSMWMRPGAEPGTAEPLLGRGGMIAVGFAGLVALAAAFWVLWAIGWNAWHLVPLQP